MWQQRKRHQKVSSCSFKPHRNYSNLFTSSNVGECSWIWIRNNLIPVPVPRGREELSYFVHVLHEKMSLQRRQRDVKSRPESPWNRAAISWRQGMITWFSSLPQDPSFVTSWPRYKRHQSFQEAVTQAVTKWICSATFIFFSLFKPSFRRCRRPCLRLCLRDHWQGRFCISTQSSNTIALL